MGGSRLGSSSGENKLVREYSGDVFILGQNQVFRESSDVETNSTDRIKLEYSNEIVRPSERADRAAYMDASEAVGIFNERNEPMSLETVAGNFELSLREALDNSRNTRR